MIDLEKIHEAMKAIDEGGDPPKCPACGADLEPHMGRHVVRALHCRACRYTVIAERGPIPTPPAKEPKKSKPKPKKAKK